MTELTRLANCLKTQSTKLTTTCMQWFFASLRDHFDEGKETIDIHIVIGLLDQVTDDLLELERLCQELEQVCSEGSEKNE